MKKTIPIKKLKTQISIKKAEFSTTQLAVFVLVFGVIGFLLVRTFAAAPPKNSVNNINVSSAQAQTDNFNQNYRLVFVKDGQNVADAVTQAKANGAEVVSQMDAI